MTEQQGPNIQLPNQSQYAQYLTKGFEAEYVLRSCHDTSLGADSMKAQAGTIGFRNGIKTSLKRLGILRHISGDPICPIPLPDDVLIYTLSLCDVVTVLSASLVCSQFFERSVEAHNNMPILTSSRHVNDFITSLPLSLSGSHLFSIYMLGISWIFPPGRISLIFLQLRSST
jgi:hypothetical protein